MGEKIPIYLSARITSASKKLRNTTTDLFYNSQDGNNISQK
jgi:hypothetical protein